MTKLYYKTFKFSVKESSEDDNVGKITGYGSIFNNVDSYGDIVVKGAFQKSLNELKGNNIKMLWQHDSSMPIGTWQDLKEDNIGLIGDALLPLEIISIKEKYQMAKAGLVDGLSIGYMIRKDGYEYMQDGTCLLKDLDLREISLVTYPANPLALVSDVKNRSALFNADDVEALLCGLGYQKSNARGIVDLWMRGEQIQQQHDAAILDAIKAINLKLTGK